MRSTVKFFVALLSMAAATTALAEHTSSSGSSGSSAGGAHAAGSSSAGARAGSGDGAGAHGALGSHSFSHAIDNRGGARAVAKSAQELRTASKPVGGKHHHYYRAMRESIRRQPQEYFSGCASPGFDLDEATGVTEDGCGRAFKTPVRQMTDQPSG